MAAVTALSQKILSRRPPSPIQKPPLVYVEGYEGEQDVRDPRRRELALGNVPEGFYLRDPIHVEAEDLTKESEKPGDIVESADTPAGVEEELAGQPAAADEGEPVADIVESAGTPAGGEAPADQPADADVVESGAQTAQPTAPKKVIYIIVRNVEYFSYLKFYITVCTANQEEAR